MKLKFIVAALGLLASASSFALIPQVSTVGGGDLILAVYEQGAANGAPDQSFTLDLGINTDTFYASRGSFQNWATLTASTNTLWNQFLSTSYLPALQFAVIGAKSTGTSTNAAVASSVFSTVTLGNETSVAGVTNNKLLSTMIGGTMNSYTQNVSGTGTHVTQSGGESLNAIGSGAYFQDSTMSAFNTQLQFTNNNAIGSTPAEFTQLYRNSIAANTAKALEAVQSGTVSFNQVGGDYVLTYGANLQPPVAAVPEASTYAMLLAGLGMLGFVGSRRKQK